MASLSHVKANQADSIDVVGVVSAKPQELENHDFFSASYFIRHHYSCNGKHRVGCRL